MGYTVDFTKHDTESLLDLVNHTNPETIGELLTYDKVDIRDFKAGYGVTSFSSGYLLEMADGTKEIFNNAYEMHNKHGIDLNTISYSLSDTSNTEYTYTGELIDRLKLSFVDYRFNQYDTPYSISAGDDGYIVDTNPAETTNINIVDTCYTDSITTDGVFAEISAEINIADTTGYVGIGIANSTSIRDRYVFMFGVAVMNGYLVCHCYRQTPDVKKLYGGSLGPAGNFDLTDINIKLIKNGSSLEVRINDSFVGSTNVSTLAVNPFTDSFRYGLIYNRKDGVNNRNKPLYLSNALSMDIDQPFRISGTTPQPIKVTPVFAALTLGKDISDFTQGSEFIEISNAKSQALLVNRDYELDDVRVYFDRINVNDLIDIPADDNAWDWYDSDEWDQATDIPLAIQMFRDRLAAAGIDVDRNIRTLTAERVYENDSWSLIFSFESYTLSDKGGATFRMPHNFSDIVTVTALNGFVYIPIDPATTV